MFFKLSSIRCLYKRVFSFFFLLAFFPTISACASPPSPPVNISTNPSSPVNVSINLSSPIGTSQFSPGLTYVDNTLDYPWGSNNSTAVNHVKSLIKQAIPYENTHIMAWGVSDLWPDPSQAEPSNWHDLDDRLKLAIGTGGIPVITLAEAPWWMKGKLQPDGTTKLFSKSEEWSEDAYGARILDNKMDAWLHLVQRIAEHYMVAPYNVRYFQVWNELKGYYNPVTNAYDYTTSPGDPHKSEATHGYTYMYNQVYSRLMQVATSLRIPTKSIKIGGPYAVMDTWSSPVQSNPSRVMKAYGTYDQRPLDVIQYWLQHKIGAGFITVDGSNGNKDNINITDPFTASEKFADVTHWLRSLNNTTYPGAGTLPIWWAEWNALPYTNTTDANYINAIKSYAMIKLIKAGGATPLLWGGTEDNSTGDGLWTATTSRGGGQPLPWYYSYKAFKDYFAPGTRLYETSVYPSGSIEALASASKVMLVNKTERSISATVNGKSISLKPYQVIIRNL